MRHLLVLALALATPWAHAVGIGSVGQQQIVPNAKTTAPMPGGVKPVAAPASTADTGPIIHRFEYDEVGNRTRHVDAEGRSTRWTHDKAGRVVERILPGGQRETMEYNAVGELVAKTDFLGRTTRYGHDAMGRVTSIDHPGDGDVSITYTPMGLRQTVTDGHGTTRYSYDRRDRLTGVEYPHGEAVAHEYDAAGNRTALVTAHQRVTYTYDARNRLETVTAAHGTTRYGYDAVGNRASVVRPNGVRTDYTYDSRNRLTDLTHRVASTGALLFGVSYTLGSNGQRLMAEESDASGLARTVTWTYDNVDRLVSESILARDPTQNRIASWTYDKVGNRLTQTLVIGTETLTTTYAYDVNDRLQTETTGAAVVRYTYDANGNTRSRQGPGGLVEYAYDDLDRLIEQKDANGRRTYQYDADGLRVGETFFPTTGSPVTTSYVFDKSREYATIIEEFVQEGQSGRRLAATFTYGDDLIAQTRGTATHYLHADGMSSTRVLTDSAASVTDSYSFDAFGNQLSRTGATIVAHLYRGEQFDPNLGLYYLRARFYDPRSGRFTTMDAYLGRDVDPVSLHKYLYAHASPINRLDPSGYFTNTEMTVAQKAMVTLFALAVVFDNALTGAMLPGAELEPNYADPTAEPQLLAAARAGNSSTVGVDSKSRRYPVIVFGQDVLAATEHYFDAISDRMLSPLLHRKIPTHMWKPGLSVECLGITGELSGKDCDEYPFKAAVEGGPHNYLSGRVSLRPVNKGDNRLAGIHLNNKLLRPCKISGGPGPGSKFAVIPDRSVPVSFGICGNGQVNP